MKNFTPTLSQRAEKRASKKHNDPPPLMDQPYTLWAWYPWYQRTRPWPFHTTRKFFMSLKVQLDSDKIQSKFNELFSGKAKVFTNWDLYIIELDQEHTLHEIQDIVNQTIKELAE